MSFPKVPRSSTGYPHKVRVATHLLNRIHPMWTREKCKERVMLVDPEKLNSYIGSARVIVGQLNRRKKHV